MVLTETDVANMALLKLGGDTIDAISDTDVKAARIANTLFGQLRDEMLRAHPWNFAVTRDQLVADEGGPDFEFTYSYTLPDGFLRLLSLYNDPCRFQLEAHTILSDSDTMDIAYVASIADPTDWDPLFTEAFATRLASEMAFALTGSAPLQRSLMEQHYEKLRVAKQVDAQENYNDSLRATELIESRRAAPYYLNLELPL